MSQNHYNLKIKLFNFADTIKIDSLLLVPNSILVRANEITLTENDFYIDYQNSEIIFFRKDFEKVEIQYRVFNYDFNQRYFSKDTSLIVPRFSNFSDKKFKTSSNIDQILTDDGLTKKGEISRGVSVGNNQEPVVNSKLNLQLTGKLTDDLNLDAVISDETRPVQPDGNTAQIQDFNNIFIRVKGEKSNIVAGDFTIDKPKSYFLNYNKQSKGLQFQTNDYEILDKITLKETNSGVAIAKGKYYRQTIKGIEANQGPYKLQGANGETFIIVISGSERIYIDGKLLSRGENKDYTIDYNSAEITFTPNQPITKDSRIVAEFEYSERNYTRFTTFSNNQFSAGNIDFFFNFYSESDAKNQTIDIELTDEMKMLLADVGDSLDLAKMDNIDSVAFDSDLVLYRKVDTVINGEVFSYYEYSKNQQLAHYKLSFAYLGENKGNYIIDENQTNGRIYKWVKPVDGLPQGAYEATTILVSPKKQQMFDFGAKIPISSKSFLDFEIAFSNVDMNLFSEKNDNDNIGKALKLNFTNYFSGSDSSEIFSKFWSNYEYVQNNFTPVELYKNQEFERNWNVDKIFVTDEHITQIGYANIFDNGIFSVDFSSLYHNQEYLGVNTNQTFNISSEKSTISVKNDFLYSSDYLNKTNFSRSNVDFKRKISKMAIGATYNQETNIWKNIRNDSLQQNSFMFHAVSFYVQNADSSKNSYKLEYLRRWDFMPKENLLQQSTFSNDFNLSTGLRKNNFNLNFVVNYRELFIIDTLLSENKPENSLSARINMNFSLFNKALIFNTTASVFGGLEQKLQFVYIEVEPTKGVYMWIDYNDDGVKQIDEFEIANYPDQANYVRVPLQSNQYVKVYGKKLTQSIVFFPQKLFSEETKINKIASKFNNSFAFNAEHKSYDFQLLNFADSNAVRATSFMSNTFNFLASKKISFSYLLQKNKSLILMVNGVETNRLGSNRLIFKYKIRPEIIFTNEFSFGDKQVENGFSINRNYLIKESKNTVGFQYAGDKIDFGLDYIYSDKSNSSNVEKLFINKLKITSSGIYKKSRVSIEVNLIDNNFHGDASSTVAYSMLEGLKPDFNTTWLINVKRNIGKTLQISFLYSGRYSTDNRVINTGSVNLTAYF